MQHPDQVLAQNKARAVVREDKSALYAQAYAKALGKHGHFAVVHIKPAVEAHACRKEIAEARHAAVQKKMGSKVPFATTAFLKADPVPTNGTPDEVVGYSATPKYMMRTPDFQKPWVMDVGGGRGKNPLNFFHIGYVDGNHNVHPAYDTMVASVENYSNWIPLLQQALRNVPKLNDPQARILKDDHLGSDKAAQEVMDQAIPFSCSVHKRKHLLFDARWGAFPVRKELVDFYDKVLRNPNLDSVLALISAFRTSPTTAACYNKFKKTPMEYTIPAMREKPTALRRTTGQVLPGPLFGEVTSNAAEVTMHMMLPVRKEANIATSQVSMLHT